MKKHILATHHLAHQVLSLFEKIEATILEVPSSNTHVLRALIVDSINNSVKTIRAFAAQDKYHFITPLVSQPI
jgi:hypothetical protein